MSIFLGVGALFLCIIWVMAPAMYVFDKYNNGVAAIAVFVGCCLSAAAVADFVINRTPPAETITLRAADWQCVSTYQERRFSGKVWYTVTLCSRYEIRGASDPLSPPQEKP